MRESLKDKDYKGEDYVVDKELKNGPLNNRKCTDVLFLLMFLAFTGLNLYVTKEATKNSDIDRLLSPVDGSHKLCGVDYKDYGFLYYAVTPKPIAPVVMADKRNL
jgi:solute carrier family 44 protein 1 (choline transporter-like protein)/choline transporter-like protein 2/4/5